MHCLPSLPVLAVVGLASLSIANPVASVRRTSLSTIGSHSFYPRQDNDTNPTTPCAKVAAYARAHPAVQPIVPAEMAYDCLNTIPLNVSSALTLIDGLKPYVNWQSTLAYLKDPPAEYIEKIQEPVNVLARLDEIKSKVSAGGYISEYEFGFELYTVFQSTHDGHFNFLPDSVGRVFLWSRPVALVSVSDDGNELPGIFGYQDIVNRHFGNASYTPSAITKIDDVDAAEFLEEFSQIGALQDRDALYNNLFFSLAQVFLYNIGTGSGAFSGSGRGGYAYPGPTTKLTFANGSETTYVNYARLVQTFNGITSGEDVADRYFYFGSTAEAEVATTDIATEDKSKNGPIQNTNPYITPMVTKRQGWSDSKDDTSPGFPSNPIAYAESNFGGYYLDEPGFEDVAVMFIPSFVSSEYYEKLFQSESDTFLVKAKRDGKTKLIIDLQANGGGTVLQGYDMFKKLFPKLDPYGGNRFRATKDIMQIGQTFSKFSDGKPRDPSSNLTSTEKRVISSYFNYRSDLNENGQPWQSWHEKFGNHEEHEDRFTSVNRWNLNDPFVPYLSGGINITGHSHNLNLTVATFASEDIVIVTDGYCASTCTIFSEFMRQQAGVKTIALGGRANTDQMQAVGGTKGTNNFPMAFVQALAQQTVMLGADRNDGLEAYYDNTVFRRAAGSPSLNVRDGIREGDDDHLPLQFLWEPADCRMFYTPEMLIDVTEIWKAVADSQWNGQNKCVDSPSGYAKVKRDMSKMLSPRKSISRRDNRSREKLLEAMQMRTNPMDTAADANGFMRP